jgi:hypothetical protein
LGAALFTHGVLHLHLAHALLLERVLDLRGLGLHCQRIGQFKPFEL